MTTTAIESTVDTTTRPDPGPGADQPRELHARTRDDVLSLAGAGIGSFALVWVLYERVLPLGGLFGFLICWYVAFLVLYGVISGVGNGRTVVVDRLVAAAIVTGAVLVGIGLVT